MTTLTRLDQFVVPLGGQEIVLENALHAPGGMEFLRVRIRERSRFTVFDIDAETAQRWAEAMIAWSRAHPGPAAGTNVTTLRGGAAERDDGGR